MANVALFRVLKTAGFGSEASVTNCTIYIPKVIDIYIKKFSKKSIIASCEDYRAGASIDLIHHKKDTKKIDCPTLVLWGKNSLVGKNFEPLNVWKSYVKNLSGKALEGGHYLPEEKPYQVANQILNFLK